MGKFEMIAIVGGIAILVFFSQFDTTFSGANPDASVNPPVATDPVPDSTTAPPGTSKIYGRKVRRAFGASSLRAIDGDSLEAVLADGDSREIRLASIDAPEWKQKFGQQAKSHLAMLIKGQAARVFQTDTDRYGRVVAFVMTGSTGTDLNARMISDGFAWHAVQFSSDPTLAELESAAKKSRRGLWSQRSPVAPWQFRK